jgi:hypothetical protein
MIKHGYIMFMRRIKKRLSHTSNRYQRDPIDPEEKRKGKEIKEPGERVRGEITSTNARKRNVEEKG